MPEQLFRNLNIHYQLHHYSKFLQLKIGINLNDLPLQHQNKYRYLLFLRVQLIPIILVTILF